MSEFTHRPVMLEECIEGLDIRPEGVYLDGTLGRAGHSREIAKRLSTGRLICVDRDQAALDAAQVQKQSVVHAAALDGSFQNVPGFQGRPQMVEGEGDGRADALRQVQFIFRHDIASLSLINQYMRKTEMVDRRTRWTFGFTTWWN